MSESEIRILQIMMILAGAMMLRGIVLQLQNHNDVIELLRRQVEEARR